MFHHSGHRYSDSTDRERNDFERWRLVYWSFSFQSNSESLWTLSVLLLWFIFFSQAAFISTIDDDASRWDYHLWSSSSRKIHTHISNWGNVILTPLPPSQTTLWTTGVPALSGADVLNSLFFFSPLFCAPSLPLPRFWCFPLIFYISPSELYPAQKAGARAHCVAGRSL